MCDCNNKELEIFTITVSIPTRLTSFVYADGTIEYRMEGDTDCSSDWCENAVKEELIKKTVYSLYSKDLFFNKFDTYKNNILACFKNTLNHEFVYFYGYFSRLNRETCNEDCQNPVPKFIIRQKYDCFQDMQSLHPAKCEWWSDWHNCTCE